MARMVTVTITYDMDDTNKNIAQELRDWVNGSINLQDFTWNKGTMPVETSEEGAVISITELEGE